MSYVLSCCSPADLSKEQFDARDIHYICFHYFLDGKAYLDDLGQSLTHEEFYARMAAGADTSTSQISISEYVDYFSEFCEKGQDILHVTLSSGISGTINSAQNAALIVRERYPQRKIYIIDSLAASGGYGLLMDGAADRRDEGMSIEECAKWIEENRLKLHHWFFSTDLSFFVKGGRISKTAAVFGGLLQICPLMNVDYQGRLVPRFKVRTKKKVIRECVRQMELHARDGLRYDGKCLITMSACMPDARAVADLIEAEFPRLNGKVVINSIGNLIGSHTGPGTVALFFWGDERVD